MVLQSITKYYRVLQSITEYYKVLQGITKYNRVLQSITKYYRVLQSISSAFTLTNFWACSSRAPFSIENAILARFDFFVANLCTFGGPWKGRNSAVLPKK